jgi:hypothetical protein
MLLGLFEWILLLINFPEKCVWFYEIELKLPKNLKSTLYTFDIVWILAISCYFLELLSNLKVFKKFSL